MAFGFLSKLGIIVSAKNETSKPLEQARRSLERYGIEASDATARLQLFTQRLENVASSMRRVSSALDVTSLATTRSFQMDRQMRSLGIQMGLTADGAGAAERVILDLSNATGQSVEQVTQLSTAMYSTGQEIAATDTHLVDLTRHFAISAEQAATMNREAQLLGTTVRELSDYTAGLQETFRLPGMMAELPKVVSFANKAMTTFSRAVIGDQKKLIESTLKTGAVLSRALGRPLAEGVQAAQQSIEFLAQTADQDRDVFLGLEGQFSALTNVLFQLGGTRVRGLFDARAQGPVQFAGRLRHELERVERQFGRGSVRAEYFKRQLQRELPDAIRTLVFNNEAWAASQRDIARANEENNSSIGTAASRFDTMVGSLREVGGTAIETFKNILTLGKTAFGLLFARDVGNAFTTVNEKLREFNTYIFDLAKNLESNQGFQRLRTGLRALGPVVVGVATAFGAMGSAVGGLASVAGIWRPLTLGAALFGRTVGAITSPLTLIPRLLLRIGAGTAILLGRPVLAVLGAIGTRLTTMRGFILTPLSLAFRAIGGIGRLAFGGIGKLIGGLAKFSIGGLIKSVFGAVLAFKSIGVALDEFGKAIRDPRTTGVEKFKAFMRAAFKGVADFADTILMGIPSMITSALGAGTFTEVFMGWGEDVANFFTGTGPSRLSAALESFKAWLTEKMQEATGYLFSPEFETSVAEAGQNIGAALGFAIREITNPENWRAAWNAVVTFFTSPEARGPFATAVIDLLTAVFNAGATLMTNIFDGALKQLGHSLDEMKGVFTDLWDHFAAKASEAFKALRPMIIAVLRPLASVNDAAARALQSLEQEQEQEEAQAQAAAAAIQQAQEREAALFNISSALEEINARVAEAPEAGFNVAGLEAKRAELQQVQRMLMTPGAHVPGYLRMAEQSTENLTSEEASQRVTDRTREVMGQLEQAHGRGDSEAADRARAELRRLRGLGISLRQADEAGDERASIGARGRIRTEVASLNLRTEPVVQTAAPPAQTAQSAVYGPPVPPEILELMRQQQAQNAQIAQALAAQRNVTATANVQFGPNANQVLEQQRTASEQRAVRTR